MIRINRTIMKKSYSIYLLSVSLFFGSCAGYYVKQGNRKFDSYSFADAVTQYQKALDKKPLLEAKQKLADSYRLMNNPKAAEEAYREVVAIPEADPINQFYFGKMLMQNGKYAEAKTAFEAYAVAKPDDQFVKQLIEAAGNPKKFDSKIDTCAYSIAKIQLNGVVTAFAATPYNFGYVITAETTPIGKTDRNAGTGNSYLDIYFTKKDAAKGTWSAPTPLNGGINTEYHDGFATFTADGQTMYFTRTNLTSKGKLKVGEDNNVNYKILKATLIEGEWSNIEEFPHNSDDFSNGHPSISKDGKSLYFISDRPGGYGQSDIYSSQWDGSTWSAPVNLGPIVNTAGRERFPVIGFDGKLFFSSDGHAGLGGMDIFFTTGSGTSWAQPQNMNAPINSSNDDFSFTLDDEGRVGNISSARGGSDQLYEVIYKEPIITLDVCAREKGTNKPFAGAKVFAQNKSTGTIDSLFADSQGRAVFRLKGGYDFSIFARNEKYFANAVDISTKDLTCSESISLCEDGKYVLLDSIDTSIEYRIDDIYYDYNKWDIRPDAAKVLDNLVKLLIDNPGLTIELGSHTDCRGTDEYNQKLSENRAKSVVKYCTLRDISPKRLTFKGYGESSPAVQCVCEECSEEQHQKNRRTVFKVIDIK